MSNLVIFCNFYNEVEHLQGFLENVYPIADKIVLCDGRYELFPGKESFSTDGSLALIHAFPDPDDKIGLITAGDGPWVNEIEKRNEMWECSIGGHLLVLDADERLRGWSLDVKSLLDVQLVDFCVVRVKIKELVNGSEYSVPRLFRAGKGLRYHWTHWLVVNQDGVEVSELNPHPDGTPAAQCVLENVWIDHLGGLRDPKRIELKKTYYRIPCVDRERGSPAVLLGVKGVGAMQE